MEVCIIHRIINLLYISIGFVCLGVGIVGIVVPLLPTTPLLLLSSFCFMKGSRKFDIWFKETSIYKRHLESFVREKAMTLSQKVTLLLFADVMILIPLIKLDQLWIRIILLLIIVYKYYYFIFHIKTKPNIKK